MFDDNVDRGWFGLPLLDHIHHCDAFDLLRALPDNSVDLVLTDMPYGTTACEWDRRIDLQRWWRAVRVVAKPTAPIVMTASQPFTAMLIMSNLGMFRYEWIWEKSLATGYLNANRNPMKAHENVLVFYQRLATYNPQMESGKPYVATSGDVGGHVHDKTVGGWLTENNGKRYPRSVVKVSSEANPQHPTQKPLELFSYLIRTYSNKGDVVLDPFMGSGTTALAAHYERRRFIGCDLNGDYVAIGRQRLQDARLEFAQGKEVEAVQDLGPLFAKSNRFPLS